MPLNSIGFKVEYFLVLHLTSMIVFGSMIWHLHKRRKTSKTSSNTSGRMKEGFDNFVALLKGNIGYVLALSVCSVLVFIFMQLHMKNFMSSVNTQGASSGISNFVESGSGHWVIFSAISTIYYFFVIPLLEDWDNIKNG